jgi:hypothetical protein
MSHEFNQWWQGDYDDTDNPYREDSPAYWAYAGWQARESELNRWKELAEYRLKLLTKMPDEKPWVGLTDEEIDEAMDVSPPNLGGEFYYDDVQKIARAIEAKLKEKNNINTYAPEDSMHINTLGGA